MSLLTVQLVIFIYGCSCEHSLPPDDTVLSRITFSSCAAQLGLFGTTLELDAWDVLRAAGGTNASLAVLMGDTVYGDPKYGGLPNAYANLAIIPSWQRFNSSQPYVAMWDDHDYGLDNLAQSTRVKMRQRRYLSKLLRFPPVTNGTQELACIKASCMVLATTCSN